GVLLEKPDVTAADCVTTDVPGFAPFCGTSAAAPHAAAIAALVMAAHPQMTAAQIRAVLTQTSLDIETPGWDSVSGLGIVMPGPALQASATIAAEPFVDLTGPAVQARNATASTGSGMQYWPLAQGWRFVAPHARLTMSFNSAQANKPMKLVLYHCTSSIWPRAGYSPVTIALNGTVVVSNFDVARNHRGSRDYAWDSLPIRSSAVKRGTNTLTIETQPGMVTHYWLRSVRLQPV
ncbi:MAG TPA: S8 family serine peptidase, partial [Xanthobacteraceae bacterium]|nr:S8 family serine peptidase [Xanthobacteraceae bacterium]